MKAGRPVSEETPYKIMIHVNGGRRYASTKINFTTPEGKKVSKHKHWGSIDEHNVFHPNTTYFNASPAERKKLIFPEGLDLSEAKAAGRRNAAVSSMTRMMLTASMGRHGFWTRSLRRPG